MSNPYGGQRFVGIGSGTLFTEALTSAAVTLGSIGSVGAIYGMWAAHRKTVRSRERFEDRLFGVQEDRAKGLDAVPGIFARFDTLSTSLASVQSTVSCIQSELAEVKELTKQLRPNGGKSLADRVIRIETDLRTHLSSIIVQREGDTDG